jgi:DNA-binding response OmpR family regulator
VEKVCIALVAAGNELWGVENIRMALSSAGYKVLAIENWETVEVLNWDKPALIIVSLAGSQQGDINLYMQLIHRVTPPVVVISSPIEESQQVELFECGVTDFLTYPVNSRELVARVHNILQRTQPPLLKSGVAAKVGSVSSKERTQIRRSSYSKMVQVISKRFYQLPHARIAKDS